jgi:cytochrome c oxidase subunit 4
MSGHDAEAIRKETRGYILVFAALAVLTVVTVAVWRLHLPPLAAIGVALFIATVKGSLVASYFMHLISERRLIYYLLLLTLVFFIALMLLPLSHMVDRLGP